MTDIAYVCIHLVAPLESQEYYACLLPKCHKIAFISSTQSLLNCTYSRRRRKTFNTYCNATEMRNKE